MRWSLTNAGKPLGRLDVVHRQPILFLRNRFIVSKRLFLNPDAEAFKLSTLTEKKIKNARRQNAHTRFSKIGGLTMGHGI